MKEFFENFFDTTSLVFLCIVIVMFVLFWISKEYPKLMRGIKIGFSICFIGLAIVGAMLVQKYSEGNLEKEEIEYDYVYGKINQFDQKNHIISMTNVRSSYSLREKEIVKVKVNSKTDIIMQEEGEKYTAIGNIKNGSTIKVFYQKEKMDENEIEAAKIVVIEIP